MSEDDLSNLGLGRNATYSDFLDEIIRQSGNYGQERLAELLKRFTGKKNTNKRANEII